MPIATCDMEVWLPSTEADPLAHALHVEVSVDLDEMTWEWTLVGIKTHDDDGVVDHACLRDHGADGVRYWMAKLSDRHHEIEEAILGQLKDKIEK